jgi:hypothetical protein
MGSNHVLLLQNLLVACYVSIRVGAKAKTHYGGQKMLSQILFFKIVWLSTSTKPIFKKVSINYTQNKVIQMSKETTCLNFKIYLWEINACINIL